MHTCGPVHGLSVLIASVSSDGQNKSAHIIRAFGARIHRSTDVDEVWPLANITFIEALTHVRLEPISRTEVGLYMLKLE